MHSLDKLPVPRVQLLQPLLPFLVLSVLLKDVQSLFLPPLGIFHHFLPFSLKFL